MCCAAFKAKNSRVSLSWNLLELVNLLCTLYIPKYSYGVLKILKVFKNTWKFKK